MVVRCARALAVQLRKFWHAAFACGYLLTFTDYGGAQEATAHRSEIVDKKFYVPLPMHSGTGSVWIFEPTPHVRVRTLGSGEAQALPFGPTEPGGETAQVEEVTVTEQGTYELHWFLVLHPWESPTHILSNYRMQVKVRREQ
jgi:hypothetical protein